MALKEVAIALFNAPRVGGVKEGDIIEVRNPVGEFGRFESKLFLWFLMDDSELPASPTEGDADGNKRRHFIPLARLDRHIPGFNLGRARDSDDDYQPFFEPDRSTGKQRRVPAERPDSSDVNSKGAARPGGPNIA